MTNNPTDKKAEPKVEGSSIKVAEQEPSEIAKANFDQEELISLFNLSIDMFCVADINGCFRSINKAWERILGYKEEELLSIPYLDFVHPDDVASTLAEGQKLLQGQQTIYFENRYRCKDGSYKWLAWTSSPSAEKGITFAVARDITEKKQMEEALKKAHNVLEKKVAERTSELLEVNRRLEEEILEHKQAQEELKETKAIHQAAMDSSQAAIVIADAPDGKIRYVNQAGLFILGGTEEELVKDIDIDKYASSWQILHFDGTKYRTDEVPLAKAIMHGKTYNEEFIVRRQNGEDRIVWANAAPILDDQGNVKFGIVVFLDITERKQAEEALKESIRLNELLMNSLPHPAMLINKKRIIIAANKIARDTGVEIGKYCWDTFGHRECLPEEQKQCLKDDQNYPKEDIFCTFCLANELIKTGISKNDPEVSAFGKLFDTWWVPVEKDIYLHYAIDITERKRAEEEKDELKERLRQGQKMEAIGTLAGGIAHDFNNTLAGIMGYTELSLLQNQDNIILHSNLKKVLNAAERGKALVMQILAFASPTAQNRKPLDIRLAVADIYSFLKSTLPATIHIRQNIQVKSGTISADPTQIQQILMNLCFNAAYAMRNKDGVLEINLTEEDLDQKDIVSYPELKPGAFVRLTISDTGHGIDQEDIDRIFDPFFTTKGPGEGTGMGLSIVHGLINNHDGAIRVISKPGEGSTFQIFFPKIEEEAVTITDIFKPVSNTTKDTRILFVDDEEDIVTTHKEILEHHGYKVIAHTSSIEALKIFRAQRDEIDLVISDMTMPGMTGEDLSKKLLQIRPDIPIIVCTGFSERISQKKAKEIGIREMLMKPLSENQLTETIHNILDHD